MSDELREAAREIGREIGAIYDTDAAIPIIARLVAAAEERERIECMSDADAEGMVCGCSQRIIHRIRARGKR